MPTGGDARSEGGSSTTSWGFDEPDEPPLVPLLAVKQSLFMWAWHGWLLAFAGIGALSQIYKKKKKKKKNTLFSSCTL